jgi:hypothetical protein
MTWPLRRGDMAERFTIGDVPETDHSIRQSNRISLIRDRNSSNSDLREQTDSFYLVSTFRWLDTSSKRGSEYRENGLQQVADVAVSSLKAYCPDRHQCLKTHGILMIPSGTCEAIVQY